jgi:uncharacterized protein
MRLNPKTIQSITSLARAIYGPEVHVYLFGSRTNDNAKGGDIDLVIAHNDPTQLTFDRKISYLSKLKMAIGDQKIDLLYSKQPLSDSQDPTLQHIVQFGNPVSLTK